MRRSQPKQVAYSRVSVKAQTVLPRAVRDALAIKAGDAVRYRFTDDGIVIDKAQVDADDPFMSFTEWSGKHDDDAYSDL